MVNPKSKVIKPQRNNTVALQHTGIPPEFGHMMRSSVSYVALGGPKTLDVEPPLLQGGYPCRGIALECRAKSGPQMTGFRLIGGNP